MKRDPRLVVAVGALAGLALAGLADWWEVRWAEGMTAGGAAGLTLGTVGRRGVGLVAAAAGLGMAALGFAGADPSAGVVAHHIVVATLGGDWVLTRLGAPIAYGVVGLLVAAASGWLVARPPLRRARGVREASGDVTDPLDSWKAMDDGHDPTDDEGVRG